MDKRKIIRCIVCAVLCAVLLVLVGCGDGDKAKGAEGSLSTKQAYASETSSAGKIFVCSSLKLDYGNGLLDFEQYAAVIYVEPITQEVFLVHYATMNSRVCRCAVGPLKMAHHGTTSTDTDVHPISFESYKKEAERQGYAFVYEE